MQNGFCFKGPRVKILQRREMGHFTGESHEVWLISCLVGGKEVSLNALYI